MRGFWFIIRLSSLTVDKLKKRTGILLNNICIDILLNYICIGIKKALAY